MARKKPVALNRASAAPCTRWATTGHWGTPLLRHPSGHVHRLGPVVLAAQAEAMRLGTKLRGRGGRMATDTAQDRAIYQALKAADEAAAALQATLVEDQGSSTDLTPGRHRSPR